MSAGTGGQSQHPEGRPRGRTRDDVRRSGSPPRGERNVDDAAGLVLGALLPDEQEAAERRTHTDAAFRREVREFEVVGNLLPLLVTLPDAGRLPSRANPNDTRGPSPALRDRILDAVAAESEVAAPGSPRKLTSRAGGRSSRLGRRGVDLGAEAGGPTSAGPASTTPRGAASSTVKPIGRSRFDPRGGGNLWLTSLLAAAVLIFAIAAIALQVRYSHLSDEVDQLHAQSTAIQNDLALANAQSNASAWVLNPPEGNTTAASASGSVFYSYRQKSVVASVHGLPPLQNGQVYQLWYLGGSNGERPVSAGIMQLDANGNLYFSATGIDRTFDTFAITVEPAGGSQQPTTSPILVGTLSAAG